MDLLRCRRCAHLADAGARFGKEQHGDKEGIRKYFLALTNEARLMSLKFHYTWKEKSSAS